MPHLELITNHPGDSPEWKPAETQVGRLIEELCHRRRYTVRGKRVHREFDR